MLHDGESTNITLAEIDSSEFDTRTWLSIIHADGATMVPNSGVIVEFKVKANPPMPDGLIQRQYVIERRGHDEIRIATI
jgi:hypothetical protein